MGNLTLSQAIRWTYIKFDPFEEANNADMDRNVKIYNEASRGIVKTNA